MGENDSGSAYTHAVERKMAVEFVLRELAEGRMPLVTARKRIGIMIGTGFYYGYSHHQSEGRVLYDVKHVAMVAGKAECFVVAVRKERGSRKGETVLIPVLDSALGFFGIVSREDYRGSQFSRAKIVHRNERRRKAAA